MKILPSTAYSTFFPICQAIVVTSRLEICSFVPVFIRTNRPVPYVFLNIPGLKHPWANVAACWSPAIPAMGIGRPERAGMFPAAVGDTLVATPLDGTILGRIAIGILKSRHSSGLHFLAL